MLFVCCIFDVKLLLFEFMFSLAFLFFFNFSIYFYHIYLHYEHKFSAVEKLILFLPQFTVHLALVLCFYMDLAFCIFPQTIAFVAFMVYIYDALLYSKPSGFDVMFDCSIRL